MISVKPEDVKKILQEYEITISEISRDSNVSRPTLYKWLSNEKISDSKCRQIDKYVKTFFIELDSSNLNKSQATEKKKLPTMQSRSKSNQFDPIMGLEVAHKSALTLRLQLQQLNDHLANFETVKFNLKPKLCLIELERVKNEIQALALELSET